MKFGWKSPINDAKPWKKKHINNGTSLIYTMKCGIFPNERAKKDICPAILESLVLLIQRRGSSVKLLLT